MEEEDHDNIDVDAGGDIRDFLNTIQRKSSIQPSQVGRTILQRFRTFGWSNGVHVPFASEANQLLEDTLDTNQKRILELQSELEDHAHHLHTLTSNFNRVSEDVNAHQILITYKKSDIKVTENLINIAERVHSKVIQEKLNDIAQTENLEKRNYRLRKQLVKREKVIAELVEIVTNDQKLLDIYKKRTATAESEIDTVIDFKIADERQLNENEAKQVDLGAKRKHLRYRLDHQAMDTAKCQEQFNRASMEYRRVHDQRKDMITTWKQTLLAMRTKDRLMKEVADEYYLLKGHHKEINLMIEMKDMLLKQENCTLKGEEMKLKNLDRKVSEARCQVQSENAELFDHVSEYTTMNAHLHSISQHERNVSKKARDLKKQLYNIGNETEELERLVEALRAKCKDVQGTTKSSDDYIREAENILQNEELNFYKMEKNLKWGQQFQWERSNEKFGIQADIRGVETRLHRIKNSTGILFTKIAANIEMLSRKASKVYRLDLDASNLETRISRIEHDSIDPSYFEMQDRIVLNRDMEQKLKDEQKFISKELEILKKHAYRTQREIIADVEERKALKSTLFETDLVAKKNAKLLKKSIKESHDIQVRYSLLQVYLKRLVRARESTRTELGSLSEHRALVETIVKERMVEIDMHKSVNEGRLKSLRSATNKLNVQIGEMEVFTSRLKGRFYLTSKMMMGPENSDPKEQSFSFQVRKAARERELLNKEVLKWEDSVEVAQKEMEGLQNVLMIMNASNDNFKKSISPAEEDSKEHLYTLRLEEIERQTLVNKSRAKKTKHTLHNEIVDLEQQVTVVEQDLFASRAICDTKTHIASSAITELYRQQDKIARWNSLITRLTREIKGYITDEQSERVEVELRLKFTMEKLDCAISMVERLLGSFPALILPVLSYLENTKVTKDLYLRLKQYYGSECISLTSARTGGRRVIGNKSVRFNTSDRDRQTNVSKPQKTGSIPKKSIVDVFSNSRAFGTNPSTNITDISSSKKSHWF